MRSRSLVLALATVALGTALLVPSASAVETQCGVRNVRSGQSLGTLNQAVEAATAGDTLYVKGTCEGDTTLTKQLTIDGETPPNYGPPTLQGRPTEVQAVVRVLARVPVTITGLTITGGTSNGGIFSEGSLTLANSTVTGNALGIINSGPEASLTLTSSTVSNNPELGGITNSEGSLTLTNSTVSGNTSNPGGSSNTGGGISTNFGGVVTLNGSTVTGNTAQLGGIWSRESSVTLNSSNVIGNTAIRKNTSPELFAGDGGGIYDAEKSSLHLNGSSSVNNNTAQGVGGGIYVQSNETSGLHGNEAHLTFGPGWNGTVSGNFPDNVFPATCLSGC
jgi:hypothetical protein